MRVPPTEPVDFFSQALTRVRHELVLAVIPDLVSVRKSVRNVATGRFNYVFPHWFRIKWRELAMPIDDFPLTVGHSLHYGRVTPCKGCTRNQFSKSAEVVQPCTVRTAWDATMDLAGSIHMAVFPLERPPGSVCCFGVLCLVRLIAGMHGLGRGEALLAATHSAWLHSSLPQTSQA